MKVAPEKALLKPRNTTSCRSTPVCAISTPVTLRRIATEVGATSDRISASVNTEIDAGASNDFSARREAVTTTILPKSIAASASEKFKRVVCPAVTTASNVSVL